MGIYARRPRQLVAQLAADTFVVIWAVAWFWLGRVVRDLIWAIADPARQSGAAAEKLAGDFGAAANQADRLPVVGGDLRRPFDSAADTLVGLTASSEQLTATIERLAAVSGWLVFAIPVSILVVLWLPRRIGFFLRARAAQRFLDSGADLDLFALRAMARQPMHVLARVSPDPVAAWRTGDQLVITQLADLELRRDGLQLPNEPRRV